MYLTEPEIQEVDKKVKETIHPDFYGQLVLDLTSDAELGKRAEEIIVLAGRHILLWDRWYEIKDDRYKTEAVNVRDILIRLIPISEDEFDKIYDNTIAPFWIEEATLLQQDSFSPEERKDYLLKKSSDVPFYFGLLRKIATIDPIYEDAFRTLQKLNDMYDDVLDIEEDIQDGVPNILLLFSKKYKDVKDLTTEQKEELLQHATQLQEKIMQVEGLPYIKTEAETYFNLTQKLLN